MYINSFLSIPVIPMKNNLIYKTLASFDQKELALFYKFLKSPFFNTNQSIVKLFRKMRRHYPNFEHSDLEPEELYRFLFPDNVYQDGSLRNLFTEFRKLVKLFLVQLEIKSRSNTSEVLLLSQYQKRKFDKEYYSLFKSQEKKGNQNATFDRYQNLANYQYLEGYYHFPYTPRKEISREFMQQLVDNLDHFYLFSKIMLAIEINSRSILLKEVPPKNNYQLELSQYLKTVSPITKSYFQLPLLLIKFQGSPNRKLLNRVIRHFKKSFAIYSKFDGKLIFKTIINLMNHIFNNLDPDYIKEMYSFYKFGVKEKILTYDECLTVIDYINIVTCAASSNQTNWATQFKSTHLHMVPPSDQVETNLLAEAIIGFQLKNYTQVAKLLSSAKLRNSKLGFQFRLLMIKNIIEMAIEEERYAALRLKELDSIEKYVRRRAEKGDKVKATLFLNFIKIARLIISNIKQKRNPVTKGIDELIIPTRPVAARHWLLEKIKSLKTTNA